MCLGFMVILMRLKRRKFGFIVFPYMPTGAFIFALMPNASINFHFTIYGGSGS